MFDGAAGAGGAGELHLGDRAAGHDTIGVVADVAAADAVNDLAAAAFDTHSADHVLCNNAGVVPSSNFGRHKTRWFDRQSGGC